MARSDVRTMSAAERAELAGQALTYEPVGATQETRLPDGFTHLDSTVPIGRGDRAFTAASEALMTWRMHRGAGLRVTAADRRATVGSIVRCDLGPLRVPCRVVWVLDEPDAQGFGYGTLPGHPEIGEEAFVVRREGDTVVLQVRAYSRPGLRVVRLAGPVARWAQHLAVRRYAAALRRLAREAG